MSEFTVQQWDEPHTIGGETHVVRRLHVISSEFVPPIFKVPAGTPYNVGEPTEGVTDKDRKVLFPMFVGDDLAAAGETIEERFTEVIEQFRISGFDVAPPFQQGHALWMTQEVEGSMRHAFAFNPYELGAANLTGEGL